MRYLTLWLVYMYLSTPAPGLYQIVPTPEVHGVLASPQSGDAIQGIVPVSGITAVEGFESYTLEFGIQGEAAQSWFLITTGELAIENDLLGGWDTTTLTDGFYNLRLIIYSVNQSPEIIIVEGLRVRNYSAIETNTPTPIATPIPGQVPTQTVTPTQIIPTPTSLAGNPAELNQIQIQSALISGGIGAGVIFLLIGIYTLAKGKKGTR